VSLRSVKSDTDEDVLFDVEGRDVHHVLNVGELLVTEVKLLLFDIETELTSYFVLHIGYITVFVDEERIEFPI